MKRIGLAAFFTFVCASSMAAGPEDFQELADGDVGHVISGWVFPKSIGTLERTEPPKIAPGTTTDAFANYRQQSGGAQISATVFVYGADTPAADATWEGAKRVISLNNKNSFYTDLFAEGGFKVGESPALLGTKTIYKYGIGPGSTLDYLYFFDTGKWAVKVRVSAGNLEKQTAQQIDEFVRSQKWGSLGLSQDSCVGKACNLVQANPLHGLLIEWMAVLLAQKNIPEVFPATKASCVPSQLAEAFGVSPKLGKDGKPERIELLATCKLKGGSQVTMLRFSLDEEIIKAEEKDSPSGLSLRGPIVFFAFLNGKKSTYTQLYDGVMSAGDIERALSDMPTNRMVDFAEGDRKGRDMKPRLRVIE